MSSYTTAIGQARDLLRWRSPLRTELWASRIAGSWLPEGIDEALTLVDQLAQDGSPESRVALAALKAVGTPVAAHVEDAELPGWAARMGRVECVGAWYGKADPYGEQVLAVLSFQYAEGKEPHVVAVGIDQVNGGLAVDALVEEPKFLDDLDLRPTEPAVVAGRILDAFDLTDSVLGAPVADSLPPVRALALSRARTIPEPVRHAPDDTVSTFHDLPDVPGAAEAFAALAEFVGERPLWWSPARASKFLTSWLPREAILSDQAISAIPEVARAWTRHLGDHDPIRRQIAADAPGLPALMADDSLAGLRKRLAQQQD